ncbi:MAG: hydroxymethylpyrimidine/phosphomethylpyrimidine kinase, partial [Holophagales bacterium]|nr:hydroxymethylpyrimidine/phosphomethylpyrimidine kinase [Holophagales bacterium]
RKLPAVLIKGGHGEGSTLVDLLLDGSLHHRYEHPRIDTTSTHGTGCTLSSAIAARLGRGDTLERAVGGAIRYLHGAIRAAYPLGGQAPGEEEPGREGHGPVDHLYRLFPPAPGLTGADSGPDDA